MPLPRSWACTLAIVDKRRQKANHCEVMNIIGDVRDKDCILLDDMVDTGGSLCHAAQALVEMGAGQERPRLRVPRSCSPAPPLSASPTASSKEWCSWIPSRLSIPARATRSKYLSVAPMFAEAIERIYQEVSISKLFR